MIKRNSKMYCYFGKRKSFLFGQNLKEALSLGKEAEDERIIQRMVIDYYNPMVKAIVKTPNLLLL